MSEEEEDRGGTPREGKGAVEQRMGKSPGRYSKKGG